MIINELLLTLLLSVTAPNAVDTWTTTYNNVPPVHKVENTWDLGDAYAIDEVDAVPLCQAMTITNNKGAKFNLNTWEVTNTTTMKSKDGRWNTVDVTGYRLYNVTNVSILNTETKKYEPMELNELETKEVALLFKCKPIEQVIVM